MPLGSGFTKTMEVVDELTENETVQSEESVQRKRYDVKEMSKTNRKKSGKLLRNHCFSP